MYTPCDGFGAEQAIGPSYDRRFAPRTIVEQRYDTLGDGPLD